MSDSAVKHVVDSENLTLETTGRAPTGKVLCLKTSWATAELMFENIDKAKLAFEKYILTAKPDDDTVYAGSQAENATSNVRNVKLPFGRKATVGVFRDHEYDEAALSLGFFKVVVPLKLTGQWEFRQARVERTSGKAIFGAGGAKNAWYFRVS